MPQKSDPSRGPFVNAPAVVVLIVTVAAAVWAGQFWAGSLVPGLIASVMLASLTACLVRAQRIMQTLRAEAIELRDRERISRTLFDRAPNLLWSADPDRVRERFNRSWCAFTGLRPGTDARRGWRSAVHPEDLDRYLDAERIAIEERREATIEYRLANAAGEHRWMLERIAPSLDRDDRMVGVVGSAFDITARKLDEAAQREEIAHLTERRDALETRVAELKNTTEKLSDKLVETEAASHDKESVISDLADGMGAPIGMLMRATEYLTAAESNDEEVRQHATDARSSVDEILQVTTGLLGMQPPTADGEPDPELDAAPGFEVRPAIDHCLEALTDHAREKGLRLPCYVEPNVPDRVEGDAARLRQALLYTTRTAIKFAQTGDIVIRASAENKADQSVIVRFALNHVGAGLPHEAIATLFNTPAPAGDSEDGGEDAPPPSGLAIAEEIVKSLGGRIGVENDEGSGFTIWFTVGLTVLEERSRDRRQHARLRQDSLECDLGEVIDISLGGMCFRSSKPCRGEIQVTVSDGVDTLNFHAQVMRSQRLGFRNHEIGVQFLHLTPDLRRRLTAISIRNRVRRTITAPPPPSSAAA